MIDSLIYYTIGFWALWWFCFTALRYRGLSLYTPGWLIITIAAFYYAPFSWLALIGGFLLANIIPAVYKVFLRPFGAWGYKHTKSTQTAVRDTLKPLKRRIKLIVAPEEVQTYRFYDKDNKKAMLDVDNKRAFDYLIIEFYDPIQRNMWADKIELHTLAADGAVIKKYSGVKMIKFLEDIRYGKR